MKKYVAVVALVAATFAAPAMPTQAATMMEEMDANCLIFPMLKAECREQAEAMFMARRSAMMTVADDTTVLVPSPPPPAPPAPPVMSEPPTMPPMMFGPCTPAPAGSGYLFDC